MAPKTPLVDPAGYFESEANHVGVGTVVFGLHLLLNVVWLYVGIRFLFSRVQNLDPQVEQRVLSIMSGIVVVVAIVLVVGWLVVAAVIHYGSGGSKTNGTFTDALGVAGWAYAPEVVFFVPGILYAWREIRQRSFDGSDPQELAAEFQALGAQADLSAVSVLLMAATTIWSVYILTYGVAETHDVDLETAALPAIAVGVGSILLWLVG